MSARQGGFTLIELLIAVSLLALLMAMLFAGLNAGTRHIGRQSERLDRASRTVLAQDFLRAQLADARALTPSNVPSDAITFDGRADGVDFVSAAPQAVAVGGLQVLSLRSRAPAPAHRLPRPSRPSTGRCCLTISRRRHSPISASSIPGRRRVGTQPGGTWAIFPRSSVYP